ncbi:MAG: hypothetical protein FJ390_02795 [Verrucomicrobia bacterium]|nr:hypothetical protein [Verrucomicrobiota bacterium]
MKSLLVVVASLLSLSVHALVAQNYSGYNSSFTITGSSSYNQNSSITVGAASSYNNNSELLQSGDVNHVQDPLLRGRIFVSGDPIIEDVIYPNNIIARRGDDHRIIHLKKGDGGMISLEVPKGLSSSAQWCLASTDQFLLQGDSSYVPEEYKGTVSIIGIDGNQIEVPSMGDSLKPIDIFKSTDEATSIVSYHFSYTAVASGMTVLNFILVETSIPGDVFKDGASFAIQVDDGDAVAPVTINSGVFCQVPSSNLQSATL